MEETSKGVPQFATAEFAAGAGGGGNTTCAACRRSFTGAYFQINEARSCAECTTKIRAQIPKDSHAAFVRALVFGIAGALLGFALYVTFALVTGLVIGWVSVAVGFIVGKAMSLGSRGAGGRRYQVVAVVLTYLAVSMSAVPIAIQQMRAHRAQVQASAQVQAGAQVHASEAALRPAPAPVNLAKAVGILALVGVASPILDLRDPVHGIIGLVILFVGIRFAWRFTAGRTLNVSGPHVPAPGPAPAPAGVI